MDARSAAYKGKEASESHGPTHKALVEARLKNVSGLEHVLKYLLTNNYQYRSMMTSHNRNHESAYCTDSAFGIMGAVNESLLYSNTGVVEILRLCYQACKTEVLQDFGQDVIHSVILVGMKMLRKQA